MKNMMFHNFGQKALTVLLCLVTLAVEALLITAVLRPSVVIGHSMNPTLSDGEVRLAAMVKYNPLVQAKRDDIVLVDSEVAQDILIKRVIAQPGDILEIRDNQVYVNEVPLRESYVIANMVTKDIPKFRLAQGQYFVMGDNRNNSTDSRVIGTVPEEEIIGVVHLHQQMYLWFLLGLMLVTVITTISGVVAAEQKALYWLLRRFGVRTPSQPAYCPDEKPAASSLT